MAKSLIAAAVLLVLLGAAYLFRAPSLSPVPGPGTDPGSSASVSATTAGPERANAGLTPSPAAAPAATSTAAATNSPAMSASAADAGALNTVAATTTFVGPDGNTHDIPPPSAELVALGDSHLRAAVMDEIRADPEAFAKAMHVELEDVQRVAAGEAEMPPHWITQ